MTCIEVIDGKRVVLRRTQAEDLPDLLSPWNGGRATRWVGFPEGLRLDIHKTEEWLERLQVHPERHHFVYAEEVGFCGEAYYALDWRNRQASLDIQFRPEAQGRGLAADALSTLIGHIFATEPEVEAVRTETWTENQAAQRLYARCGLRPGPRPFDLGTGPSYGERCRTWGKSDG